MHKYLWAAPITAFCLPRLFCCLPCPCCCHLLLRSLNLAFTLLFFADVLMNGRLVTFLVVAGVVFMAVAQLFNVLASHGKPRTTCDRKLQSLHRAKVVKATPQQLQHLKDKQIVHVGAKTARLVSRDTAVRLCRALKAPACVIGALESPRGAMAVQAAPQPQPAATGPFPAPGNATAGSSRRSAVAAAQPQAPAGAGAAAPAPTAAPAAEPSVLPEIQTAQPTTLPACTLPRSKLRGHYGLATIKSRAAKAAFKAVRPALQQVFEWSRSPVQLDRPRWVSMLKFKTAQQHWRMVVGFLGYIFMFHNIASPALHHYLSGELLVAFISYVRARGGDNSYAALQVAAAIRIVEWLGATGQLSTASAALLPFYRQWLNNLQHQLACNLLPNQPGRRDPVLLEREGRWLDPYQVTEYIMVVYNKALPYANGTSPRSMEGALLLFEACFACLFWGYMLPLR